MERKKIELLAPAGDMERLQMAAAYGADAVYLAGTTFGMRSFAGNFTPEALKEAVELCHRRGIRVHVTCNTMPRNNEVARLPEWLEYLDSLGVDAIILADVGTLALAAAHAYFTVDDILEEAASRGEAPLIVICDELSDPHNLGAILRSAECAGAHGVIIPKRRSVGLTATVAKASAGAVEYMKVARVTNINTAIAELKDKGVWVFGTAAEGSIPMYKADLTVPAAIVIGNEGEGLSQLVRKNCDVMVSIPMKGKISSLNASAAASILLYEAVRQRIG